jgi:UrcA family protein
MNNSRAARTLALSLGVAALSAGGAHGTTLLTNSKPTHADVHTYVVRFGDLDLARPEGTAELYARLRHAAHIVCEPLPTRDPRDSRQYKYCVDTAIAEAVLHLNRPLLSQYHAERSNDGRRG